MNLRDLHYLTALAQHQHFGRAAAACFISQPTLSMQIRKLEAELGVALVERTSRKVLLTAAGQEMATRARRIVAEVEQMKETARRSRNPEAGSVRLGLFPTLAAYLLPHVMPVISQRFPQLELRLVEEKSDLLLAFLFEEPFVLAVPQQHNLAQQSHVNMEALAGQQLLLLQDGHCLRDQALAVCHWAGAQETNGFQATSLETLRQMVAAGVGITLLPLLAVQPPVTSPANLRLLPFSDDHRPSRQIGMVWRRSSAMSRFLQQLAVLFSQLPEELLHWNP